jgi:hypothetical protein
MRQHTVPRFEYTCYQERVPDKPQIRNLDKDFASAGDPQKQEGRGVSDEDIVDLSVQKNGISVDRTDRFFHCVWSLRAFPAEHYFGCPARP